jgi:FlaA1/EpsC-like NDP-sugar epimerase
MVRIASLFASSSCVLVSAARLYNHLCHEPPVMSQLIHRFRKHLVDGLVLSLAFIAAFLVRFDGVLPEQMLKRMVFLLPYVVLVRYLTLMAAGVPRFAWSFVGLRESGQILQGVLLSSTFFVFLRVVSAQALEFTGHAQYLLIPYGVIVIDTLLAFLGIAGVRVLARLRNERRSRLRHGALAVGDAPIRVLLVGAGAAGAQVARGIIARPDMGLIAVGFVDDDRLKHGSDVHGLRVMGDSGDLGRLVAAHRVSEVIITIANASVSEIRHLVSLCASAGVTAKIIPALHEILDGRVEISRIRRVSIDDLLGRDVVSLDLELVGGFVAGRSVMITGAGGSIGSELCRQVARLGPARLVLVERAEPSLFSIHCELSSLAPELEIVAAVADVGDGPRVATLMARHEPAVVFHAAAHKHVPLMEINAGEAIKNNVFGTRTLAAAACAHGVETFVLISTDKAVNPTSVMGATKRVAEVLAQSMGQASSTRFVAVRFGNVLGSAGSVIPIFADQIAAGGPVTVTHPDMQRYFMTIPEASQLVIQAGAMGKGGEIFTLDMGEPVRIVDLARDMIRLSGFEPDEDIKIVFSGIRPGEKLFEELRLMAEALDTTDHPKIYGGRLGPVSAEHVAKGLERLLACCGSEERRDVMEALRGLVPELQEDARESSLLDQSDSSDSSDAATQPSEAASVLS